MVHTKECIPGQKLEVVLKTLSCSWAPGGTREDFFSFESERPPTMAQLQEAAEKATFKCDDVMAAFIAFGMLHNGDILEVLSPPTRVKGTNTKVVRCLYKGMVIYCNSGDIRYKCRVLASSN